MSDEMIRPLSPSDAVAAAELIRAAFADQGRETAPPSSALKETAEVVSQKLVVGGGFGCDSGGELVGLVLYAPQGEALFVGRLSVRASWRGRGLGARLMAAAEEEARRLGFATTRLNVRLVLAANRRLYARLGYEEITRGAHPGFSAPTFAILEKRLDNV